ncbi:uncharacterized protein E0L32_003687 [Thyridium curvatum]|uniref:DUF202 domain-containing protein n=1 Tax=Thyridium curvatum TaxID=1093900 RepID=A0A507BBY8_9PEZI|nr:uncharacterized protein E0L32_003687 [Thyridium curvatum]TPX16746.1 hypothetical protein E0L32_003687 [Thyridium curvatum]
MISRIHRWFLPPTYRNTGSVARDHLASERTFLAWMRTGLGFVAFGIAVERFQSLDLEGMFERFIDASRRPSPLPRDGADEAEQQQQRDSGRRRDQEEQQQSRVLVMSLLAMGAGSIMYGGGRYFANLRRLEGGTFRPAYNGAAVLAAAVAGMAGGVGGSTVRRGWERQRRREWEWEQERRERKE